MFHNLELLHNAEGILLIASVILFFSIFAGKAGYRFGLPALLLSWESVCYSVVTDWESSSVIRILRSSSVCWR